MTDRELMQQVYQYLTGEAVRNKTTDKHIAELISEWLAQPEQEPLTDEEILKMWDSHTIEVYGKIGINPVLFARYLEREYGIGEKE